MAIWDLTEISSKPISRNYCVTQVKKSGSSVNKKGAPEIESVVKVVKRKGGLLVVYDGRVRRVLQKRGGDIPERRQTHGRQNKNWVLRGSNSRHKTYM